MALSVVRRTCTRGDVVVRVITHGRVLQTAPSEIGSRHSPLASLPSRLPGSKPPLSGSREPRPERAATLPWSDRPGASAQTEPRSFSACESLGIVIQGPRGDE